MPKDRPELLLVVGPSGAGKSSAFPVWPGVDRFIVDEHLYKLNGNSHRNIRLQQRIEVNRQLEAFKDEHFKQGRSFATENTLRHPTALDDLKKAKEAGFSSKVSFVSAGDVEAHVKRAQNRADVGLHYVSEPEVRDIYQASMRNLPKLFEAASEGKVAVLTLYDNSGKAGKPPVLVARIENGYPAFVAEQAPAWMTKALKETPFNVPALRRAIERQTDLAELDKAGDARRAAEAKELKISKLVAANDFGRRIGAAGIERDMETARERLLRGAEAAPLAKEIAGKWNDYPGSRAYARDLIASVERQLGPELKVIGRARGIER
jgi:predicted ABC-type ATPase